MTETQTRAQALEQRLAAQIADWELWDSDPTAAYEKLADAFYRETGFIVPGKSLPTEMESVDHDARRRQRYQEWTDARKAERRQMFSEVLQALAQLAQEQHARHEVEHECSCDIDTRCTLHGYRGRTAAGLIPIPEVESSLSSLQEEIERLTEKLKEVTRVGEQALSTDSRTAPTDVGELPTGMAGGDAQGRG
jgi:hypothetical protein